ncbi:uroporphyrinogen-III synthase [Coemansia brasiliensis]|uniref:Uroporphyrinogen-III synthase n=1 Tax=Coemansia brasiliensis TaxID=2650707 RepID=A0A9W8M0B6_9FUNG|nr:uroporphyrinogen-III synthase [Coemansia brasiliensis]
MSKHRSAAVLFRDHSRGGSYAKVLQEDGHFAVETVPVLDYQYLISADDIGNLVHQQFNLRSYSAIIFTSQNAVKALSAAATQWLSLSDSVKTRTDLWNQFLQLPIFVVGKATGSACTMLGNCQIYGEESGSASVLLPEIIKFSQQKKQETGKLPKFLFICGDQRRDTLPDGIRQSGEAELFEVTSYKTIAREISAVASELSKAVRRILSSISLCENEKIVIWLVLFSPSGARVVYPALNSLCVSDSNQHIFKFAAIGKTTASELLSLGANHLDTVQAKVPNEQGIKDALHS